MRNLFLIGLMGAGKTTVGRHLAELLDWPFLDSDQEIEARTGASIPWIFEKEGEKGFRQREAAMIAELSQRQQMVLATGGGAVLNPASCDLLRERGTVIYLQASLDILLERLKRDRTRPLLQVANPAGQLAQLLQQREPLYAQTAHVVMPVNQGSAREVAELILKTVRQS